MNMYNINVYNKKTEAQRKQEQKVEYNKYSKGDLYLAEKKIDKALKFYQKEDPEKFNFLKKYF
jgi:hypothetical protein